MRIALTGVSGFIGCVIARQFSEAGHAVTGLVRTTSRRDHIEPFVDRLVVGDQTDSTCYAELLEDADAIVHNAADWRAMTSGALELETLIQANVTASAKLMERSRPIPFIFMSSVAVHHDISPRWEGRIDTDHPTRPGGFYGAYKAAVEAFLWAEHAEHDRPFCALRPCAVYGLDPKLERSIGHPIIKRIAAGEPFTRRSGGKFVHVEDVARATVAAATDPERAPNLVDLADCYARWSDWANIAAELLGVEARIDESSPPEPKNMFAKDAAEQLGVSLERGHGGIRGHLADLIEAMRTAGDLD